MNRCKYFILFLLLFLTGCSYRYDLKIDKYKKVSESIDIFEVNSAFDIEGTSNKQYINMLYNIYENDSNYNNYKIDKYFKSDYSGVLANAIYDNFYLYMKNNKVKKTLFGQIELFEDNGHGFFKAYDYRGELFFTSEESDFKNDFVEFSIILPFDVVSNNADKADLKKGIYTWYFDEDIIDKEVNLEFDLKKIVVKENFFVKYFYLCLILIFALLFVTIVFIKNKRVNKI